jgi:inorganic pyrophosphatase
MDISKISTGSNPPSDVNVIIEVPMNSLPVKYEFDKDASAILVDRFLSTAMFYPVNYGFVPHTLSGDGDPVDALVISPFPVVPQSVIRCRPIGVLKMEDESGQDEKILFVPHTKLTKLYENVKEYQDIPEITLQAISHFFERYKDLEKGKWVKILGWSDAKTAEQFIVEGIERFKNKK